LVYIAELRLWTGLKRSVGSHTDVDRWVVASTWRRGTAWSWNVGMKEDMGYLARLWAGRWLRHLRQGLGRLEKHMAVTCLTACCRVLNAAEGKPVQDLSFGRCNRRGRTLRGVFFPESWMLAM